MSDYGITSENLLRSLPTALANDPNMLGHAKGLADAICDINSEVNKVTIYTRIEELPEDLLDILARDFNVSWYEYNATLSVKRRQFRDSFLIHRRFGTKWAVRTALTDHYPGHCEISEWFEYDGNPSFFKIIVDLTEPYGSVDAGAIGAKVNLYKPVRARLEEGGVGYQSRAQLVMIDLGEAWPTPFPLSGTFFCGEV